MGNLDFSEMEDYLAGLVQEQLEDNNGMPHEGGAMQPCQFQTESLPSSSLPV
jgi:hypothetical protein